MRYSTRTSTIDTYRFFLFHTFFFDMTGKGCPEPRGAIQYDYLRSSVPEFYFVDFGLTVNENHGVSGLLGPQFERFCCEEPFALKSRLSHHSLSLLRTSPLPDTCFPSTFPLNNFTPTLSSTSETSWSRYSSLDLERGPVRAKMCRLAQARLRGALVLDA